MRVDKIILFGANGMCGRYLYLYLVENNYIVLPLVRKDYDPLVHSHQFLDNLLKEHNLNENSIIINALGLIPQANKNDNSKYIIINTIFPNTLSVIAYKYKAKLIHISTDCVFNGDKGSYSETDKSDESSIYGLSKYLGEVDTVIRASFIGEEIYHKRSLLEWVKSQNKNKIDGYINFYWNGITCLQFAKIIDQMIKKNKLQSGVKHIFSPKKVSKYELIKYIIEVYGLDIELKPFEMEKPVDKSLNSIYDIDYYEIPDIKTQIKEMYDFGLKKKLCNV